jgi:hypothetical protein
MGSVLHTFIAISSLGNSIGFYTNYVELDSTSSICALMSLGLELSLCFLWLRDKLMLQEHLNASSGSSCRGNEKLNLCRENSASLFSLAYFSWFSEMIRLGRKNSLELHDLWDLYPGDTARLANQLFLSALPHCPTFIKALWATLKHHILMQFLTGIGGAIFAFSGPFFLNKILRFLSDQNSNYILGYLYVLSLFLCTSLRSVLDNQTYFRGRRIGLRIRSTIIGQVHLGEQCLRLTFCLKFLSIAWEK